MKQCLSLLLALCLAFSLAAPALAEAVALEPAPLIPESAPAEPAPSETPAPADSGAPASQQPAEDEFYLQEGSAGAAQDVKGAWEGDYVYFGANLLSRVNNQAMEDRLDQYDLAEGEEVELDGLCYVRESFSYYQYQPIQWRVLETDGTTALIFSEQVINAHNYDDRFNGGDINWENSGLRAWLNGRFLETTFTDEERALIQTSLVPNSMEDEGCGDTEDKVFLFSANELRNPAYGFSTSSDESESRHGVCQLGVRELLTTPAPGQDYNSKLNTCYYWTRSLGDLKYGYLRPTFVNAQGAIVYGGRVYNTWSLGIRPVMRVTLDPDVIKTEVPRCVYLDEEAITLKLDESWYLSAFVGPITYDLPVTWSSSDPSVASVDENGRVTAHKVGTAVITASIPGGKSASCTVTAESFWSTTGVGGFVSRLYTKCLGREPDESGYNTWVRVLNNGSWTAEQVAWGFIFSKEYTNRNVSNDEFVKMLYRVYMDREYDQSGYNTWMNCLASGWSREQVMEGFSRSKEFRDICARYGIEPW